MYRSEVVDAYDTREHNVMFEGACITAEHLYGMHENRALRFEIFQYSPAGSHSSLGFVQTSASAFKFAKPGGKLYMVPGPASKLKHAFVALETVKIGLSTRRGKVSSLFCLCADGFVWGEVEGGYEADDYLERDAFGRRRVDHVLEPVKIVRGVSYMGGRGLGESDQDDDESDALSINQLSMTEEE